jgi:hypothetical protein
MQDNKGENASEHDAKQKRQKQQLVVHNGEETELEIEVDDNAVAAAVNQAAANQAVAKGAGGPKNNTQSSVGSTCATSDLVLLLPFDMEMHCLSFIVNESTAICNMNAFIVKHVQHIRNQFGRKSVM